MPLQFQIDRFRPFLDRPHAYNFEANRLSTFEANPACFHACHISPGSFAKQGFYSTGNADEVKCYKCRQSHSNWQSGQELYRIHRQLSPICASFTDDDAAHQGVKPNIAIPLRQEDIRIHIGSLNGLGLTAHRIGVQESGNGYSDFSVHDDHNDIVVDFNVRLRSRRIVDNLQRGHLHSEFSSVWKREHTTFYEFPPTRLIWSLKRHGFFSVGHDDIVMCFFCGLALNRWEPGDDPRDAHIRLTRGSCKHLRTVERENFIQRSLRQLGVVGNSY